MTKEQKKLILDLSLGNITFDEFSKKYSEHVDSEYILKQLQTAFDKQDSSGVEYALLLGFLFKNFTWDFTELLNKLIQQDWHYKHEDIAYILQQLRSPSSVDALYNAALKKLEYLDYDDSYALARKCIHALGNINTEYSKEKLKLLATSDIPIIKEKAEKQLYFYKR
jgi:hypothetical protein